VESLFERVVEVLGPLDILVSNAGIQRDGALVEMSLEDWEEVLRTNLTGAFLCARQAARLFLRPEGAGETGRARGNIIFTSSVHESIPWSSHVNYAASKGGLRQLMRSIAQELASHRVRVNAVAPGAIRTPINHEAWSSQEGKRRLLDLIPYGRIGEPDDVAEAVVWLASDASSYVTGATLVVDGGMTLYPGFSTGRG
jgi:glucose 1-dehydrogenase